MSYQQPAFMVNHPAAALSAASITDSQLTTAAKRSLIDFRVGDLAVHSIASSVHTTQIDFGSAWGHNRLVIPAGHNLEGETFQVYSDDNSGMTSATLQATSSSSPAGVIDLTMGTPSPAERYWQVNWPSTSAAWEIPEIWYGARTQLTSPAVVDPTFEASYVSQTISVDYPGGRADIELAPPRRLFSLEVQDVDPSGADYAILVAIAQTGQAFPFWYWPPDSLDPGPYLVKLVDDVQIEQDFSAPLVAIRYTVSLALIEQTL